MPYALFGQCPMPCLANAQSYLIFLRKAIELIIRSLVSHPDPDFLTLLIDVSETLEKSELDASLIVSGIVINLLMAEDLDINGEPEIILLKNLNRSQWSDILPQIQYRIKLNAENHQAIAESGTAQIPVVEQNLAISPLTPISA